MAQLRLVHRRSRNWSRASVRRPIATFTPSTLGNKLQRLALVAPAYLDVVEKLVDLTLNRVDKEQTLVAACAAFLSGCV